MLQTSTTDLLNLSSKISHNRIIMTSPATGTISDGGIIPTLDGRILHNSSNKNLIFKMLLVEAKLHDESRLIHTSNRFTLTFTDEKNLCLAFFCCHINNSIPPYVHQYLRKWMAWWQNESKIMVKEAMFLPTHITSQNLLKYSISQTNTTNYPNTTVKLFFYS